MRKFIRNDYTFINRLKKLKDKYLEQEQSSSIFSRSSSQGFRMYLKIGRWIEDIKDDMRLDAMQIIKNAEPWKKEYECVFNREE